MPRPNLQWSNNWCGLGSVLSRLIVAVETKSYCCYFHTSRTKGQMCNMCENESCTKGQMCNICENESYTKGQMCNTCENESCTKGQTCNMCENESCSKGQMCNMCENESCTKGQMCTNLFSTHCRKFGDDSRRISFVCTVHVWSNQIGFFPPPKTRR